jgi:phosphate acetyltransferase
MMVRQGDADCMVAGCAHATGTLLQNAAMTVGLSPDISAPSSMFIMVLPRFLDQKDTPLVFADAAVRVAPDARRLAEIGVLAARNTRALLDIEPVVAFLSFSTRGSAAHERVDMVKEAVSIARNMAPDTAIDGELQADAAIVPAVAAKKAPESTVAGRANVLVFPDLASGNIAYKLVQYTAQAHAIGPVLQGFDKPVNDLSRGASVDDIVYLCAVTAVQYLRTNHGETI